MNDKIKDGGPAFPQWKYSAFDKVIAKGGMTLRDYFAAKAMQSIISNFSNVEILEAHATVSGKNGLTNNELTAYISYQLADAMLKERGK